MRTFIQCGGKVNLPSANGFFPLHLAASKGDVDTVSLLVENMSPEEISQPGFGGCTPLHLAVFNGHLPVVSVLASHGASLIVNTFYHDKIPNGNRQNVILGSKHFIIPNGLSKV